MPLAFSIYTGFDTISEQMNTNIAGQRGAKRRLGCGLAVGFVVLIIAVLIYVFVIGSAGEREAYSLYEQAQSSYNEGDYSTAIAKINRALELTNGGHQTMTIKFHFFNGEVRFLRGQAYEALGQTREALADYDAAIDQGNKFLTSYALNSNPEFDAKKKFKATLQSYHRRRDNLVPRGSAQEAQP